MEISPSEDPLLVERVERTVFGLALPPGCLQPACAWPLGHHQIRMTRSDGLRLVTELEAEKILLARGHTQIDCVICGGTGTLPIAAANDTELPLGSTGRVWRRSCHNCEGAGWRWQEPDNLISGAMEIGRALGDHATAKKILNTISPP